MSMAFAIAAFVIPLGFDTLAASIALGLRGVQPWRPAFLFTAFEVTMPLVGIGVGRFVAARGESMAGYLGGMLVIGVGLYTLREAFEQGHEVGDLSFRTVRGMIAAGLGISSDEIAIGFPLGALGLPVGTVLAAIGIQAFLATAGGILVGRTIGNRLGEQTSRISGVVAGTAFVLLGTFLIAERLLRR
jgi:manganese efflux pump family protein